MASNTNNNKEQHFYELRYELLGSPRNERMKIDYDSVTLRHRPAVWLLRLSSVSPFRGIFKHSMSSTSIKSPHFYVRRCVFHNIRCELNYKAEYRPGSRHSVASIATQYGLDSSGFVPRWVQNTFSYLMLHIFGATVKLSLPTRCTIFIIQCSYMFRP